MNRILFSCFMPRTKCFLFVGHSSQCYCRITNHYLYWRLHRYQFKVRISAQYREDHRTVFRFNYRKFRTSLWEMRLSMEYLLEFSRIFALLSWYRISHKSYCGIMFQKIKRNPPKKVLSLQIFLFHRQTKVYACLWQWHCFFLSQSTK